MLQDLKFRVWSAIVASASFGQSGASDYGAFVALAFTVLRTVALALQQSLPAVNASVEREGWLHRVTYSRHSQAPHR